MNQKQFENLKRGDLVRHKGSGDAYVVEVTHPAVIAIHSVTVTNPTEWNLVDVDGRILDALEERRYTQQEIIDACSEALLFAPLILQHLRKLP